MAGQRKITLMTVEQIEVVDFVGIDPRGRTVLTISDHLPWDDIKSHLLTLQESSMPISALLKAAR
jgi:hypothetical protein